MKVKNMRNESEKMRNENIRWKYKPRWSEADGFFANGEVWLNLIDGVGDWGLVLFGRMVRGRKDDAMAIINELLTKWYYDGC